MWMHIIGLATVWSAGYFLRFGALYTVYWPLPVARFSPASVIAFAVGLALVEFSVLCFIFNIFATIIKKSESNRLPGGVALRSLLVASFGLDGAAHAFRRLFQPKTALNGGSPEHDPQPLPVFVVAVMRGSIRRCPERRCAFGGGSSDARLRVAHSIDGLDLESANC